MYRITSEKKTYPGSIDEIESREMNLTVQLMLSTARIMPEGKILLLTFLL
jgi:hypothetical protein